MRTKLPVVILAALLSLVQVAYAQQLRLSPIQQHDRDSVLRELARQRDERSAEVRRIDAQIERVRGRKGGGGPAAAPARGGDYAPRIVNGVTTVSFPAVGALLHTYVNAAGISRLTTWCTGTLVGSRTFITAAHCVAKDLTPGNYRVFFQHAGAFGVSDIAYQKDIYSFPRADVAIVKLAGPVDGIPVQPLTDEAVSANGLAAIIVGFGRTGGTSDIYGIKRTGYVKTSACNCNATPIPCGDEEEFVCWMYDALIASPGMDSNTCNADSGGPLLFVKEQGKMLRIGGTTSGGTRESCLAHDNSYDLAVFKHLSWIGPQAGDDMGVSSPSPLVGDVGVMVHGASDRLDGPNSKRTYAVTIPVGAKRLVVAMNADDTLEGDNRFHLELRAPGAAAAAPRCAVNDTVQFKACRIDDPAPGDWSVTVIAERGSGEFQLVSTTFPR